MLLFIICYARKTSGRYPWRFTAAKLQFIFHIDTIFARFFLHLIKIAPIEHIRHLFQSYLTYPQHKLNIQPNRVNAKGLEPCILERCPAIPKLIVDYQPAVELHGFPSLDSELAVTIYDQFKYPVAVAARSAALPVSHFVDVT